MKILCILCIVRILSEILGADGGLVGTKLRKANVWFQQITAEKAGGSCNETLPERSSLSDYIEIAIWMILRIVPKIN